MPGDQPPRGPPARRKKERTAAERREDAIGAAIEVLARLGARGLTHREIDRQLGWPLGSASNYFRRRIDIFNAIAARLMELDLADLALFDVRLDDPGAMNVEVLVEHVVQLVSHSTAPEQRGLSLARAEILSEASRNEEVREAVEAQMRIANTLFERLFAQLGATDPKEAARFFSTMMSCTYVGFSAASEIPDRLQLEAVIRSWVAISLQTPARKRAAGRPRPKPVLETRPRWQSA